MLCAGCVCACVCLGCANECCAPGVASARGVWGLRGERVTHSARARLYARPRAPQPRDSTAAGRELQPRRTSPRRPRGRGEGGFLPAGVLPAALVWAGRGQVERREVCNSPPSPTCLLPAPPPPPLAYTPLTATTTHRHTRTHAHSHRPSFRGWPAPARPCLTCPEDPSHWGNEESVMFREGKKPIFPLLFIHCVLFLTVEGEGGG